VISTGFSPGRLAQLMEGGRDIGAGDAAAKGGRGAPWRAGVARGGLQAGRRPGPPGRSAATRTEGGPAGPRPSARPSRARRHDANDEAGNEVVNEVGNAAGNVLIINIRLHWNASAALRPCRALCMPGRRRHTDRETHVHRTPRRPSTPFAQAPPPAAGGAGPAPRMPSSMPIQAMHAQRRRRLNATALAPAAHTSALKA